MRPIDADLLMEAMYHRAFETDDDTMWQSGCWVRYRAIEQVVNEQPTVDAVEVQPSAESAPSAGIGGVLERNIDNIRQAGLEGKEFRFRIGGRLFAVRELPQ